MSDTWSVWANGVLNGLGAPINQTNIDTLFAWSSAETDPYPLMRWNNPLDTTQPEGAGNIDENSVGVKAYPTVEQGIAATVITLLNGHYPLIVSHLRNSVPRQQWADCCTELGVWGTGCGWIGRDYGAAPQVLGEIDLTPEQDLDLKWLVATLKQMYYDDPSAPASDWPRLTALRSDIAAIGAELDAIKAAIPPVEPAEPAAQPALSDQQAADVHTIASFLRKFGVQ